MMKTSHFTFYRMIALLCALFYAFIFLIRKVNLGSPGTDCFFVKVFGIPCAGCGGSHAIQHLMSGHWIEAIVFNPLAVLVHIGFMITSGFLLFDVVFNKQYLVYGMNKMHRYLQLRCVSILLALMLIIFWMYNLIRYY